MFGQLLIISQKKIIVLKPFNSKFSYAEVWFTDKSSKPVEIEDKSNITLVIKSNVKYIMTCYSVHPIDIIFVRGFGFLSFAKKYEKQCS